MIADVRFGVTHNLKLSGRLHIEVIGHLAQWIAGSIYLWPTVSPKTGNTMNTTNAAANTHVSQRFSG